MKHLLLLLLIVSCTPEGTVVKNDEVPLVPCIQKKEEQKSPCSPTHDIPPAECNCIKIFRPVCADGRTFGNSCEAECQGHHNWSEGACN